MPDSPLAPHASTPSELKARQDAERAGTPFLLLRDGDGAQIIVTLDGARPRLTLGRRPDNDVALVWDERASRLHAVVEQVGSDWVLADDGLSANGTWIGDTRVTGRRRLRDGDLVRVGGTVIAFRAPAEEQVATALGGDSGVAVISPAQRRVLVALCRRFLEGDRYGAPPSNAELAAELFLSVDSIKTHMKALFDAFGLDGIPAREKRAALVDRAVRSGTVTERDLG